MIVGCRLVMVCSAFCTGGQWGRKRAGLREGESKSERTRQKQSERSTFLTFSQMDSHRPFPACEKFFRQAPWNSRNALSLTVCPSTSVVKVLFFPLRKTRDSCPGLPFGFQEGGKVRERGGQKKEEKGVFFKKR